MATMNCPLSPATTMRCSHLRDRHAWVWNISNVSETPSGPLGGSYWLRISNDAPIKHFQKCAAGILIVPGKGNVPGPDTFGKCWMKQNESGYSICGTFYSNTDEHHGSPLHCKVLSSFTKEIALLTLEHASRRRCSNIQIVNCLGKRWILCVLVGQ